MRPLLSGKVVLALLALLVFAPALDWGVPHATGPERVHGWGNDDALPLSALSEMHASLVEAGEGRNVAYPWFYFAMHAGVYAPTMGALWLAGELERPSATYPYGFADPVRAIRMLDLQSRLLHLLLAVALVLAVQESARALWGDTAGLCAGICSLSAFPLAYYVRVGNPDVPMLAFTALALAVMSRSLADGLTVRRAAWLGVFVGLAATTKDQSGMSFVLAVPTLLAIHLHRNRAALRSLEPWKPIASAAAGLLATFAVAGGALIDPERFVAHFELLFSTLAGGEIDLVRHPTGLIGTWRQLGDLTGHLIDVMGPVMFALGLFSVGLAAWRDRRGLVLALASLGFLVALVPIRFSLIHYLLPVALPLYPLIGFGIAHMASALPRGTAIAVATSALLSGGLLLRTVDLTHAMLRDSRYEAGAWLDERVAPGERLLFFGPPMRLPYLRADVTTVAVESAVQRERLEKERPEFVYVTPDESAEGRRRVEWRRGGYAIFNSFVGPELWERLVSGEAGYRLVARFQTPRLLAWVDRPHLSYPAVNPPIHLFVREDRAGDLPRLRPWATPPHGPGERPIHEPPWASLPATGENPPGDH